MVPIPTFPDIEFTIICEGFANTTLFDAGSNGFEVMKVLPVETVTNIDNSGDQHIDKNVPSALLGFGISFHIVPS